MIRTEGPTITLNGAWAQNINQKEMFIDFIGTKGGIRLQYGGNFKLYDSDLNTSEPEYPSKNHFENELNAFVECIHSGEKLPSHIDTNIITSKIMQAIYDSAESHREIAFE
jgi:predicted dehydrogenase